MQCTCQRVNYCNETCMREARPEHRLSCPASKPTTNNMKPGAIVRISGLKNAKGRRMNGHLAEILEIQKDMGRIGVAMTLNF